MERELRTARGAQSPNSILLHWPKPCEQFTHSTQRVQDSPFVNKRTRAPRTLASEPNGYRGARRPTPPKGLRVTRAFRHGSPYYKDFEATTTAKNDNPDRFRFCAMSGGDSRRSRSEVSDWLTMWGRYLAACKASTLGESIIDREIVGIEFTASGAGR